MGTVKSSKGSLLHTKYKWNMPCALFWDTMLISTVHCANINAQDGHSLCDRDNMTECTSFVMQILTICGHAFNNVEHVYQ